MYGWWIVESASCRIMYCVPKKYVAWLWNVGGPYWKLNAKKWKYWTDVRCCYHGQAYNIIIIFMQPQKIRVDFLYEKIMFDRRISFKFCLPNNNNVNIGWIRWRETGVQWSYKTLSKCILAVAFFSCVALVEIPGKMVEYSIFGYRLSINFFKNYSMQGTAGLLNLIKFSAPNSTRAIESLDLIKRRSIEFRVFD